MEDKNFENLLERDEPKSIHGSNITNWNLQDNTSIILAHRLWGILFGSKS